LKQFIKEKTTEILSQRNEEEEEEEGDDGGEEEENEDEEEEEEEEEEDEESDGEDRGRKKPASGFNAERQLSPVLSEFLGVPALPRPQVGQHHRSLKDHNLCHAHFLLAHALLRWSSGCGNTSRSMIFKTQVINDGSFLMMPSKRFSVSRSVATPL